MHDADVEVARAAEVEDASANGAVEAPLAFDDRDLAMHDADVGRHFVSRDVCA